MTQQYHAIQIDDQGSITRTATQNTPIKSTGWIAVDALPTKAPKGMVNIYKDSQVQQVPDHRGKVVYSTVDGAKTEVDYIGEIKDGYTTTPRPSQYHKWQKNKWELDTAAYAQAQLERGKQLVDQHIQETVDAVNASGVPNDDGTTRAVTFANIDGCAKYTNLTTSPLHNISIQLITFADDVWTAARKMEEEIKNGTREMPTEDGFTKSLPVFEYVR